MDRLTSSLAVTCLGTTVFVLTVGAKAQERGTSSSDERAIRAAASQYMSAVRRGDGEAMKRLWTADGDYVDAAGRVFKVHDLLGQQVSQSPPVAEVDGPSMPPSSLRFVTPDVAIEDGVIDLGKSSDGEELSGRFTAVWVKQRGRWLLSSLREAVSSSPATNEHLQPLSWLLGEWIGTADGVTVLLSSQWSSDGNYIVREFLIRRDGHEDISATQRIGWDASAGRIKSWTFDSQGGSGEGHWRHDGDRWVVESLDVTADGKESKTLTANVPAADGQFHCEVTSAWDAENAPSNGANLPKLRVEFKRALEDE
jgi:uncharacterized protein (TIGR02246 family)